MYLVLKIALLVSFSHALPRNLVANNKGGVVEIKEDSLTSLETKFNRFPKETTGNRLSKWNLTSLMHPEEMGEYGKGDIQMPVLLLRNGITPQEKRWKNGVIPYIIDKSFNNRERKKILEAIADYHLLTCLRFVPRTTQKDYVDITAENYGCRSNLGRIGSGRQMLNLQRPECVWYKGTALHELLHTIGFHHEHSRVDRNKFVDVHFDNIKEPFKSDFYAVDPLRYSIFGPYDYNSVLHYSPYAYSKNGKETVVPKVKGAKIGQTKGLSRGDVRKINKMYNCKNKEPKTGWDSAGIFETKKYKGKWH